MLKNARSLIVENAGTDTPDNIGATFGLTNFVAALAAQPTDEQLYDALDSLIAVCMHVIKTTPTVSSAPDGDLIPEFYGAELLRDARQYISVADLRAAQLDLAKQLGVCEMRLRTVEGLLSQTHELAQKTSEEVGLRTPTPSRNRRRN